MEIINILRKLDGETKAEVYLVGGFVRDYFRGKSNDDYDIVIRKLKINQIALFLKNNGAVVKRVKMQDGFSILLAKMPKDKDSVQISLPRRGLKMIPDRNNSLRQDALQRDLRVNAMFLPINYKSKKDIIDLVGGKSDIDNGIIRSVGRSDYRIKQSPIRILRAIALAARTGYDIDKDLCDAIHRYRKLLSDVPVEKIQDEFNEILLSDKPSKYLKMMRQLGVMAVILPEVDACYKVTQERKYHKHDVFHHCAYTCDFIDPDIVLRLAALLHDVGKPPARKVIKGKITFHKHEVFSASIAKDLLTRLRYKNEIIDEVVELVRNHMYYYDETWTDVAIKRFINRAGINDDNVDHLNSLPLFKLRAAERLGNGYKYVAVPRLQKSFQERLRKVYTRINARHVKDLAITGSDIISVFNVKPGPKIGEILRYLLDRVTNSNDEYSFNTKKNLLRVTLEYIERNMLEV